MDTLAYRLTGFTASEVALLLVALQYAVFTPAWCVAALVLRVDRRATGWWAGYAAASALGLACIVVGMHAQNAPVRALGNVLVVAATLALQRGVWAFSGQRPWNIAQAGVLVITMVLAWLAMQPAWVPVRIAIVAGLWAGVYLWSARDVWVHVHHRLQLRWGAVFAMPMLVAALMLAARSVRAVVSPETVTAEVEQNTVLSVGSSITGLVAALVLQMSLVSLLVLRLVGRLERLSRHDPLTALLNRRAMDELLAQEEQRVRRMADHSDSASAAQMAVLMIDIDHFKRVNDLQGHGAGDRALQHLATVMAAQLRDIDHLARWGGEEFLALLPATQADEAEALAERLCERVRSLPLARDDSRLMLTVSVGVAAWLGPHDELAALLSRADRALYTAKHDGRDCVRVAPTAPTAPALAAVRQA
jgi:diguanylate cyclase (GGDEF)-like protein